MAAVDQEFAVADVIVVSRNVSILSFPAFPQGGTLIVLQPPCPVSDNELTGYVAEISTGRGNAIRLDYEYWHKNPDDVIGLLSRSAGASTIPLRSKVRFVKRTSAMAKQVRVPPAPAR
jgi:hypothetical protein